MPMCHLPPLLISRYAHYGWYRECTFVVINKQLITLENANASQNKQTNKQNWNETKTSTHTIYRCATSTAMAASGAIEAEVVASEHIIKLVMLQFMDCVDYVHFPIFLSGWITF